jgi:hypothetical protein
METLDGAKFCEEKSLFQCIISRESKFYSDALYHTTKYLRHETHYIVKKRSSSEIHCK